MDTEYLKNQKHYNLDTKRREMVEPSDYHNKNDVAGVDGFVQGQNEEVDKIKEELSNSNEKYLKEHPELKEMLGVYLVKILDHQPDDVLSFTGNFFSK